MYQNCSCQKGADADSCDLNWQFDQISNCMARVTRLENIVDEKSEHQDEQEEKEKETERKESKEKEKAIMNPLKPQNSVAPESKVDTVNGDKQQGGEKSRSKSTCFTRAMDALKLKMPENVALDTVEPLTPVATSNKNTALELKVNIVSGAKCSDGSGVDSKTSREITATGENRENREKESKKSALQPTVIVTPMEPRFETVATTTNKNIAHESKTEVIKEAESGESRAIESKRTDVSKETTASREDRENKEKESGKSQSVDGAISESACVAQNNSVSAPRQSVRLHSASKKGEEVAKSTSQKSVGKGKGNENKSKSKSKKKRAARA